MTADVQDPWWPCCEHCATPNLPNGDGRGHEKPCAKCQQAMSSTVHTVPVNDLIKHNTAGGQCPCGPTTEPVMRDDGSNGWLVTHHSLDGREVHE